MGTETIHEISTNELASILDSAGSFVLSTHTNPDGDALGSELALARFLLGRGKDVSIINTDPVPGNLLFLDADNIFQTYDSARHDQLIAEAEVILFPDMNSSSRVKRVEKAILASPAKKIVIDHHTNPLPFADGYYIKVDASSTAEIVYGIIESIDPSAIGSDIALGLYTGIMTDTGSFRFERTTPEVHRIAAKLLEAGVEPHFVYSKIYDEYPMKRTRLIGMILETVELICRGKASILTVTKEMFAETETDITDVENMVNFGLSIRDVVVTAFLTETESGVKISFRSRGAVTVNLLARSFGGGGHIYASGAALDGETIAKIKPLVAERLCALLETLPEVGIPG